MRFLERQIDRAFRHGADGSVIFQPSWGRAYLVPSAKREMELRDGLRRFTIGAWLFALGCPILSGSGRLAASWLWSSTGSAGLLRASIIVRLAFTLLYFIAGVWWVSSSLRSLAAGLQATTPSWTAPAWVRHAALRATRSSLVFMAVTGAVMGVGAFIVLVSFRFLGRSEALVVTGLGVVGLGSYLWCRILMRVQEVS